MARTRASSSTPLAGSMHQSLTVTARSNSQLSQPAKKSKASQALAVEHDVVGTGRHTDRGQPLVVFAGGKGC
jgi:hypothetical protein